MSQPPDPIETGASPSHWARGRRWRRTSSVAVAEPESVNLGLVVGSERALLVDTGSSPVQGRPLRASVATVTDRPLTAVVGHPLALRPRFRSGGVRGPADHRARVRTRAAGLGGGAGPRPPGWASMPPTWSRRAGNSRWRPPSTSATGGWRSPTSARAHRGRPGGRGAGRGRGLRRRSDRVGRPAVVRPDRLPYTGLGGHPRRGDRADDRHYRAGPRARRPGRPGVRLRGSGAGSPPGPREACSRTGRRLPSSADPDSPTQRTRPDW